MGERGEVKPMGGGFEIRGEFEGESARDLNRRLLSEMRRVEKTRIRAEWTSAKTVERFFDYVPKGTGRPQQE
jgi:coenzyme F420-reducing hydrogenase delta subunit